jgi:exosortase C (VPDSG-CTERM-specific)
VLSHELIDLKGARDKKATDRLRPARQENWPIGLGRTIGLITVTVILIISFARPLSDLAWYSLHNELYSYIPLIPLISLYLIWSNRRSLVLESKPAPRFAVLPLSGSLAILSAFYWGVSTGWSPTTNDYLALMTLSCLLALLASFFVFLGRETLRTIAFPLGFLIFTVPVPGFLQGWIESFLQWTSAQAAAVFFWLSATPVFWHGLVFDFPGFSLEVAPECSGIHSSLILFITSLVAGQLFLRGFWNRVLLTLCVIPLAILRNGLRIFVIGQLCVRVSPDMINSYVHRHGGPIFFALALIAFFLVLLSLRKSERRGGFPS